MTELTHIHNLISRLLNGDCSEIEIAELSTWTNTSENNQKEFLQIKDLWDLTNHTEKKSTEQLILFYRKKLDESKQTRIKQINRIAAIAAVLLIGFVSNILFPWRFVDQTQHLNVYSVPLGSRSKIVLYDGTEVYLNSGSTLTYPTEFANGFRRVTLTGEAFFKVKSDKKHPFIVKTDDFDVEATGTQFNVSAYYNDSFSATTLAEGAVMLRIKNSNKMFRIMPGEKFRLNHSKNTYDQHSTNLESEFAWKDGEFIFNNVPFPELVQRLERWYDVKLQWSGKRLESFSYTGSFKNQETIWEVLDALELTTPINYQKIKFREFKINYKSNN